VVELAETGGRVHRADVDGLRAVAVLAVVLWHYGAPGIGSGYVGVDVFFVISGFVITGLIRRQAEAGELTILGFYERRVRRIAPALVVLLAAVLAAAIVIEWPAPLMATAKVALGALSLTANLMLAGLGGYFDARSLEQPLLHTWSLTVEEQFYLVYPLLFALVWAKARRS
jgi:peptidoglycan/LPS O-acetylase OafA/YrhL